MIIVDPAKQKHITRKLEEAASILSSGESREKTLKEMLRRDNPKAEFEMYILLNHPDHLDPGADMMTPERCDHLLSLLEEFHTALNTALSGDNGIQVQADWETAARLWNELFPLFRHYDMRKYYSCF